MPRGSNLVRHGMTKTPVHRIWRGMIARCQIPGATSYPRYGAKGVVVCSRWQIFENFYADMGDRPSPHHTLDRIDNSKGYEPGNCRWATQYEQQNNRSNLRRYSFNGRSLTDREWAAVTGIHHQTIRQRILRLGWSVEEALTRRPSPLRRSIP